MNSGSTGVRSANWSITICPAGLTQEKYARNYLDPLDESISFNYTQSLSYTFLKAHIPGPARMLEIGCGNGRLLHLARQDGWTVCGLELSPFLAGSVKQRLGIEVTVANFLEYRNEGSERYDVVVLRHVLEHLPDAKGALRSIGALLADSGCAFLEVPNVDALEFRLKRWLRKTGLRRRVYPATYRPGHCNEFCRESFEYLLNETGFELVVWETYSCHPFPNFIYHRIPIGNKARAIIRKKRVLAVTS